MYKSILLLFFIIVAHNVVESVVPVVAWPPITNYTTLQANWTQVAKTNYLAPRAWQSVVYDSRNSRLVIFGGQAANGSYLNDVWTWSFPGERFIQIFPTGTPPPCRAYHVAGMDQTNQRMLIFGGKNSQGTLGDFWQLNLNTGREAWTQLTPPNLPPGRWGGFGGSWVGDTPATYFFVAYGKTAWSTVYSDTWAYNLVSNNWVDVTSSGGDQSRWVIGDSFNSPTPRFLAESAVIGPNTIAIYGGCGAGGFGACPSDDGWYMTYNGVGISNYFSFVASCPPIAYNGQGVSLPGTLSQGINRTSQLFFYGGTGGVPGDECHGENIFEIYDTTAGGAEAGSAWARTRILPVNNNPLAAPGGRRGASMTLVHPAIKNVQSYDFITFFGGSDASNTYRSDLWYLTGQNFSGRRFLCVVTVNWRLIHGVLMYVSFGWVFPGSMMLARFAKDAFLPQIRQKSPWLWAHAALNIFGIIIMIPALVIIILEVSTAQFTAVPHAYLGIIAFGFVILNPLWAVVKPTKDASFRPAWSLIHWWVGRLAIILGLINIMLGILQARAAVVIFALYIVHLAILVFIFLLIQILQYRRAGVSFAEAFDPSYKTNEYDY